MTMKLVPVLALFLALSGVAEACQQYRDVVHDRNGNVLSGVSITVKRSGVSTATTIYSDSLCATISANPITSGSTGEFIFYAVDGQYDLDMTKVGYTFIPITDLSIYDPLGEHVISMAKYQTDDICATGTGAIDQIGATVATLLISRPATCSTIKVIPTTLTLAFDGQGDITTNSPASLTVNGPVRNLHGRQVFKGTGTYAFGALAGPNPYGYIGLVTPTYASTVSIDAAAGKTFIVTASDTNPFTIAAPSSPASGQEIRITIKNTSGGALGTATWNAAYKMGAAWTHPADTKNRSITFYYDGNAWIEVNRSAADVSN
jgi:hypothetical protein